MVNTNSKGNEMDTSGILKQVTRALWESLDKYQRSEYRKEAMHLHAVYGLSPQQSVGVIRRMVRIGSWK